MSLAPFGSGKAVTKMEMDAILNILFGVVIVLNLSIFIIYEYKFIIIKIFKIIKVKIIIKII